MSIPNAVHRQAHEVFAKLDWTLNEKQITARAQEAMEEIKRNVEEFEQIPAEDRNFQNTILEPSLKQAEIMNKLSSVSFAGSVSTNPEVRKAAVAASQELSKLSIELGMRKKSYQALLDLQLKKPVLDTVERRLFEFDLRDFKRNGLALSEADQEKLKAIKQEISQLAIQFRQNLNENTDFLELKEQELSGIPDATMKSLETLENGKKKVAVNRPNWTAIMEYCEVSETRKAMGNAWDVRCNAENIPLLEKIVELRQQAADLLGYENFAQFVLEIKMAETPNAVNEFQSDLITKLKPYAQQELEELLKLKNEQFPEAKTIEHYDWRYYARIAKERKFEVNLDEIKKYFPTDHVVNAMLEFYQQIFGFTFYHIEDAPTWHEDVTSYAITDSETGTFKGVFFLDLYPRDGKYGHAAAFTLIKGRQLLDGSYHPTASAMVCNFNKPTIDEPAFLSLDQVRTLFHEFGHIIHQTTTKARFYRFSGSSVARDFVEAPSQMLENWIYEPEVMAMISKHFQTGETLPAETVRKLKEARSAFPGLNTLRQLFFGTFDMQAHTSAKIDAKELWNKLYKEIILIDPPLEANGSGTFAHIISGYTAGYYGYQWARAIAQDLYTRFESEGPTSQTVGMDYRRYILEPGNEMPEMDLVEQFLGRPTNNKAYMRYIGLE